jgi:hypothetical protein
MRIMANVLLRIGVFGDYRLVFWDMARPLLREKRIEDMLHVAVVAHHLITFARDAAAGRQNASFYSTKLRARRLPGRAIGESGRA